MNSTNIRAGTENELFFGWLDFSIFGCMLGLSTLIGIYFGFWGKKEDTPKEYLHEQYVHCQFELIHSFLSGVTSLGVPTEIYVYGTLYMWICVTSILLGIGNYYIFLPVFYELQLTSTYEVLSGINVHYITPIIAIICIFYTMLGIAPIEIDRQLCQVYGPKIMSKQVGGIKAVVWTDFLQGFLMVGSSVVVACLGLIHVGGFGEVWRRNEEGGRIRMSLSPFERMTFWNVCVSYAFHWGGQTMVSQGLVQKFLSLPTYRNAKISLVIFVVGLVFINLVTCFIGMLMFAAYHDCDPLKTKGIPRTDQILPYYVMDIAGSIPGLPGLFIAGIFSASLSTMSSSLNSVGATLFEDFVRPCLKHKISDKAINNIIKFVVVIIGAICVINVFVVDRLGTIVQVTGSAVGVTNGAILGIFSFGMLYPRGNAKGALAGGICSMLTIGWIVFGTQTARLDGRIKDPELPTSVEGCGLNATVETPELVDTEDDVFILYKLSFMYYTMTGCFITMIVGAIVSQLTEPPTIQNSNPKLFSPFIRKYVNRRKKEEAAELDLLGATTPD
ncbi:hypothetical protein ANN_15547 [Periplaneta americana]|uniref:Sodium-coupled monocarboxylate transporter 2 n=1 Tax=Periplaneta americana TaxID=6978 RepID=A0ABQ8SGN5_PERAM|nr:hypothetical protein ANN_15547 [Periplaneta americana]